MRLSHAVGLAVLTAFCAVPLGAAPAVAADAPPPASSAAPSLYDRAYELFVSKKFREAIAILDTSLAAKPRDARALVLRGDAKASNDDDEGALKDYNTAIGIAPEYQYAYETRCETRLDLGDVNGALTDCEAAVRLDPTDAKAYQDRGGVHFEQAAYTLALADYDKAIQLGAASAFVYAARCDADRLGGKPDRARADCDKALEKDPKSPRGLWANGRLASTEKRWQDGIAYLNAYIALDPKAAKGAYYHRGYAYNRIASWRNALDDLQIYVQKAPNDADGYRERATARYGLGDKDGALADLATALKGYRKQDDAASAAAVNAAIAAVRAGRPIP